MPTDPCSQPRRKASRRATWLQLLIAVVPAASGRRDCKAFARAREETMRIASITSDDSCWWPDWAGSQCSATKSVETSPLRKAWWRRIQRWNGRVVSIPVMTCSSSARRSRAIAISRVGPHPMTLESSES